jgi:chromosome segregation ATPase
MSTQTVIEAEDNLRKAQAEARRTRIAEAENELKKVRATAKLLRNELDEIVRGCAASDLGVAAARAELSRIDDAISERSGRGGDILSDPEDHTEDLARLRAYREETAKKFQAAQQLGSRRMRGIEIGQQLEHLQFVAANLLNAIEDAPRGWQGGISTVR